MMSNTQLAQQPSRAAKKQSGYTIMELLITVAIITLVASIALPSYQQHVMRSHRGDAMTALLKIANQQEKFYLENNSYTTSLTDLDVANTNNGYYSLEVTAADTDTFVATATAKSGGPQEHDNECKTFGITAEGSRTALSSGNSANDAKCWR